MPSEFVPLGEFLSVREEQPDATAVLEGTIPIVAKVRFADGAIELRHTNTTQTKLILVRPGDILISGINALKGAIALYPSNVSTDIAATIHYSAYSVNEDAVLPVFIHEYLRSSRFRMRAVAQLPSGIKTELKSKRLLQIRVPKPSKEEQEARIRDLFSKRRRIAELYARRRPEGAMILGRRVTVAAEARRAIASRLAEFERNILVEYKVGRLEDHLVSNLRHGISTPCSADADGPPVLMPSSTTGFVLDTSRVMFAVSNSDIRDDDYLEPGDIIFARGNKPDQVGNCGVYEGESGCTTFANLFMRLRIDQKQYLPWFAQYWLMTPCVREHVRKFTKGTGPSIQKINGQGVKAIPFPDAVPLDVQTSWIKHLTSFRRISSRVELLQVLQAKELEILAERVTDEAFSGL
jgi:restriction endonuclease S subunit